MLGPCMECKKRHTACHDHCADYQSWKSALAERNDMIKEKKSECFEAEMFRHEQVDKAYRRKRSRM